MSLLQKLEGGGFFEFLEKNKFIKLLSYKNFDIGQSYYELFFEDEKLGYLEGYRNIGTLIEIQKNTHGPQRGVVQGFFKLNNETFTIVLNDNIVLEEKAMEIIQKESIRNNKFKVKLILDISDFKKVLK
jgi:hypothetical protein